VSYELCGLSTQEHLLALTSGGFVYVASVGVLPQVLQSDKASPTSQGGVSLARDLTQTLLEALGFSVGVAFMIAVAYFEE
jgi:zinc transporter ZupT